MDTNNKWDVYSILQDFLEKLNEKDREDLESAIRDYFLYKKPSELEERLRNAKKSKIKAQERHFKELIRLLYLGFDIPYDGHVKKEDVFTKHSPRFSYLQKFLDLKIYGEGTERGEREFADRYYYALEEFIQEARQRIWVYEYLGKGRVYQAGSALPHYGRAHEKIFRLIEKQLGKHSKLDYIRLLVLPFSYPAPSKSQAKEKIAEALIACSHQVFEHICNCLKLYGERSRFYVVWRTTYVHHFGILDNSYVVTEYYRYNHNGDFVPAMLFVEKTKSANGNDLEDLMEIYAEEINKSTGNLNRAQQIDKEKLIDATVAAYRIVLKNIEEREDSRRQKKAIWDLEEQGELDFWKKKRVTMEAKIAKLKGIFPGEVDYDI